MGYYAVFMGYSDYAYAITIDSSEMKVSGMTKVWNDQYAFNNMPGAVLKAKSPQVHAQASANPTREFFDCCEKGSGWAGCNSSVASENATFSCQAVDALPGPHITDQKTVKDYLDWMGGVVKDFGAKATYEVKAQGFDSSTSTAMFYAVFMGYSDYVYSIKLDSSNKVSSMTKVWNDQYAFNNMPPSARKKVTVVV